MGVVDVMCQSNSQPKTALSSTEAKSIVAAMATKNIRRMMSAPSKVGLKMDTSTQICKNNQSAIRIATNSNKPTGRSGHTDIKFFAIQDWKNEGGMTVTHAQGMINPEDDLTTPPGCVLHSWCT